MIIYRHSDDLGITLQNSQVILDAWEEGFLDGFSILANPYTHDYIKKRLTTVSNPARIAVHLNLNDGLPLSDKEDVDLLINRHGYLNVSFRKALWLSLVGGNSKIKFLDQVESEWKLQIEKVKECIGEHVLTSLDGHYHIQMVPALFNLATRLCKEYIIPQIRVSREFFYWPEIKDFFSFHYLINFIKHMVLNILSAMIKLPPGVARSADYIAGILNGSNLTKKVVKKVIKKAKDRNIGSLEIIFHIGVTDRNGIETWTKNRSTIKHYSSNGPVNELNVVNDLYE